MQIIQFFILDVSPMIENLLSTSKLPANLAKANCIEAEAKTVADECARVSNPTSNKHYSFD